MKFAVTVMLLALAGCDRIPASSKEDNQFVMPDGLKDCKVFRLTSAYTSGSGAENLLTVVRCPNSTTTSRTGEKNAQTVTTVETK